MKRFTLLIITAVLCLCICACSTTDPTPPKETNSQPAETVCSHADTVILPSVSPTCITAGMTEGIECADCGVCLATQKEIPRLPHTFNQWEIAKYPTHTADGLKRSRCDNCGIPVRESLPKNTYNGKLGSAGNLSDKTIIVSIFANDLTTKWDTSRPGDVETIDSMLVNLRTAVEWITARCLEYNVETSFVYDWKENPDLKITLNFNDTNMIRQDGEEYLKQRDAILDNIDPDMLKYKYQAQNILYILYFNTSPTNTVRPWAISDRHHRDIEVINAFVHLKNNYTFPPSCCAHEILHLFGAYDLYYSSDTIPQKYVDYCKQTKSKDIMFSQTRGNVITEYLSTLDAFYLGLTDTCDEIEKWGLGKGHRYKE